MKENLLGPRQWAFVVITGGAACALPFLQTDSSPTPADSPLTQGDTALTSSPQDAALAARYAVGSSDAAGGALIVPGSVGDMVPAIPPPRLPAWANADRSPFDDLVGETAAKPEAPPPSEPLPMQPLRPWIAGPADAASLVSSTTPPLPGISSSITDGAIARNQPTAAQASPWNDEPATIYVPIEQMASSSSHLPDRMIANTGEVTRWPDQAVSAEEVAQATRTRERELASAIVAPAHQRPTDHSSALLAAPALPVAAQRTGQTYLPPEAATLPTPTEDLKNPASLPPTRKSHIIFQPGNWR